MTVKISDSQGYFFSERELRNPDGRNNLTAFASSFQRSLYRDRIFPTRSEGIPAPLDTWYQKGYFGKVDVQQNTVIPAAAALTQVQEATFPLFALAFVTNSFSAFVNHMSEAYLVGAVSKTGNKEILFPQAKGGYEDPSQRYTRFHDMLAEAFVTSFKAPSSRPIDNFKTFIYYYSRFLKRMAAFFPVTKTNLVLSYRMGLMGTGLSISLSDSDPADDKLKYEAWIQDPNFLFYNNAAKKFGLRVAKNRPWVLTADLFTDAAMEEIQMYLDPITYDPVTKDNFFKVFYKQTYLTDFDDLLAIFLRAYRFLSTSAPLYQKHKICKDGGFDYTTHIREQYNLKAMTGRLDPKEMIDLYIDLRQVESQHAVKKIDLLRIRNRAYELYTLRAPTVMTPYQRAAKEINKEYRKYIYPSTLPLLAGKPVSVLMRESHIAGSLPKKKTKSS
jgi:hypothetical protein